MSTGERALTADSRQSNACNARQVRGFQGQLAVNHLFVQPPGYLRTQCRTSKYHSCTAAAVHGLPTPTGWHRQVRQPCCCPLPCVVTGAPTFPGVSCCPPAILPHPLPPRFVPHTELTQHPACQQLPSQRLKQDCIAPPACLPLPACLSMCLPKPNSPSCCCCLLCHLQAFSCTVHCIASK
jgi:hypothetical protein